MNTLHANAIADHRTASNSSSTIPINIDRSSHPETLETTVPCEILPCDKPITTPQKCAYSLDSGISSTELNKKKDLA